MQRIQYFVYASRSFVVTRVFIWSGWVVGLLLGWYLAHLWQPILAGMIFDALCCGSSLIDLLIIALLPYILFVYAIKSSEPWLLPVLCCIKAFMFAFCAVGIAFAFGSAGWLVRFFALFCEILTVPVFLFYCHFFIGKPCKLTGFSLWFYPVYSALTVLFDHYLIRPVFCIS